MIKVSTGGSLRLLANLGVDLTGKTVTFVFAPVDPAVADAQGFVLDLTGGGGQTRTATIVGDPTTGQAAYTLTSADTLVAGRYRAQFQFDAQVYPATGFIELCIQDAVIAPASFSAIADFNEPVRAIMGDFRLPYKYEDTALASVVRSMVRMGKVPGYSVTADGQSITPVLTLPGDLVRLSYWSARTLLAPNMLGVQWRTRAMSIRRGEQRDFLRELENIIYYAENPAAITSFQTYYAWVNAVAGLNVWALLTEMKINSPIATVTLGTGGLTVSTS